MKRENYLDTIKLVACIGIYLGHYIGAFYNFCEPKPDLSIYIIKAINSFPINILYSSEFLLTQFYIISGLLAGRKNIQNKNELLKQIIRRYLRFVLPIGMVNLFVFIMLKEGVFCTEVAGQALHNMWISSYYSSDVKLTECIVWTLALSPYLNGPLWVVKYIFIGNLIVYLMNYLSNTNKSLLLMIPIIMYLIYSLSNGFSIVAFTLAGFFVGKYRSTNRSYKYDLLVIIVLLLAFCGGHDFIVNTIAKVVPIVNELGYNSTWLSIYAGLIIIFLHSAIITRNCLEAKWMLKINELSFFIFLIHWPLICSFSLRLYLSYNELYSYTEIFIYNLILTTIVCIVLAFIVTKIYQYLAKYLKKEHLLFGKLKI